MFSLTILGLVAAYMAVLFAVAWHQERPAARARGKGLGRVLCQQLIDCAGAARYVRISFVKSATSRSQPTKYASPAPYGLRVTAAMPSS